MIYLSLDPNYWYIHFLLLFFFFFFKNKYGKIAASVSQVLGRILRDVTDRHENPSDPSA